MRLFIITDLVCEFKVVEISKIILNEETIDVILNYWSDLEYYDKHGTKYTPIKTETLKLPINYNIENFINYIYNEISKVLPTHDIIYHKPRE